VTNGDPPPGRRRDVTVRGSVRVPSDGVEAHRAAIPRNPTAQHRLYAEVDGQVLTDGVRHQLAVAPDRGVI
jgi:hypothetical protein